MTNPSNRRRILSLVALASLVLVAGVGTAIAGPHGRGGNGDDDGCPEFRRGGDPEMRMERLFDRLDLDETQRANVEQLMLAERETMRARLDGMRELREAVGAAVHADTFDESAIRDASTALGQAEADMAVARARHLQQIRQELTPAQWAEFQEMAEKRKARGEQGNRGRRGRPNSPGQRGF